MATVTQSFESNATILEIRSKIPAFQKEASVLVYQNRMILNMLKRWGTVKYGQDLSWSTQWNAVTSLPAFSVWHDDVLPDFEPGPVPIQFTLGDGAYKSHDKLTKKQFERLKGERTRIQNYYKEKSKYLATTQAHGLNFEFLHALGTADKLTGLDAVLSLSGGTNTAADIVAVAGSSTTYAGQTLRPGARGGSWTSADATSPNADLASDWPILGNQTSYDPEMTDYDATAPLTLNTSSTAWASGSGGWQFNCEEVMRYYISVNTQRGAMVADPSAPLQIVCGERRLREAREFFSAKNYGLLPVPAEQEWGMPERLKFEGAVLSMDSDVNADVAYCIQPDMLSYHTSMEGLWEADGPNYVGHMLAWLYLNLSLGRLQIQPKFIGQLKDVA